MDTREADSGWLLEYSPEYAAEGAADMADQCGRLGVELPAAELGDLMPEWDGILP